MSNQENKKLALAFWNAIDKASACRLAPIFEKYLSIDADLPCEMSPTINDCIPTSKATSPQKVGLINLSKTGTEIIDINFGKILLISCLLYTSDAADE